MTQTTEFRKQWSHAPTPIPPDASGLWYSEECVDQMLRDFTLKLAEEAERDPVNIWKSLPRCCGYPKCDGDLVGLTHSSECALYNKPEPTPAERVAAWLKEKVR